MALHLGIPGPVQVWISEAAPGPTGGPAAFKFVGWSVGGVNVAFRNAYRPVMADSHGSKEPYTQSYAGSEASITMRVRTGSSGMELFGPAGLSVVPVGGPCKPFMRALLIISPYKDPENQLPVSYRFPRTYIASLDEDVSANGYNIGITFRAVPIIRTLYVSDGGTAFKHHCVLFTVSSVSALNAASLPDVQSAM